MDTEIIKSIIGVIGAIVSGIIVYVARESVIAFLKKYKIHILFLIISLLITSIYYLHVRIEIQNDKINDMKDSNSQTVKNYEERISLFREKISLFEEKVNYEKEKYNDEKDKASDIALERDKLDKKVNEKEQELNDLSLKFAEMQKNGIEVDSLEKVIDEKKAEILLLKQEKAELTNKLQKYKNKIKKSEENFKKLENELAKVEEDLGKNVPDDKSIKTSVDSLRKVIKEIKKQKFELPEIKPAPEKELPKPVKTFRSQPIPLSENEVTEMLRRSNFFDSRWYREGIGFRNEFRLEKMNEEIVVCDYASGLMWEQSGSPSLMNYNEANRYIEKLNNQKYAGFNDWRLPTLEEAMSLMERTKSDDDLWNDPVFNSTQRLIWTCDQVRGESRAWIIFFDGGYCYFCILDHHSYVRAVCSMQ